MSKYTEAAEVELTHPKLMSSFVGFLQEGREFHIIHCFSHWTYHVTSKCRPCQRGIPICDGVYPRFCVDKYMLVCDLEVNCLVLDKYMVGSVVN